MVLKTVLLGLLVFFISETFGQTDTDKANKTASLIIRHHGGLSYINDDFSSFYGGRILLPASSNKRFGLTYSKFSNQDKNNFYSMGIILEANFLKHVNSSIGTIGYFNYENSGKNLAGITTNTGWQPNINEIFKPYIAYRSDFIFDNKLETIQSFYIGVDIVLR